MPGRVPVTSLVVALVVLVAVAAVACDTAGSSPGETPEPTPSAGLDGTAWTIVSIGGTTLADGSPAHLAFEPGGRVSGSTGCNSLMGAASIDGPSLAFGPLGTTRRGCEQQLMVQETAVLDALAGVSGWTVDADGQLHLTGTTELVLAPESR